MAGLRADLKGSRKPVFTAAAPPLLRGPAIYGLRRAALGTVAAASL
jgi:hypothetical protein